MRFPAYSRSMASQMSQRWHIAPPCTNVTDMPALHTFELKGFESFIHMIGVTSAGEVRLTYWRQHDRPDITRPGPARQSRPARGPPARAGALPPKGFSRKCFPAPACRRTTMVLKILFTAAAASKHIDFQRALVRNLWAVQGAVGDFGCTASPRFS